MKRIGGAIALLLLALAPGMAAPGGVGLKAERPPLPHSKPVTPPPVQQEAPGADRPGPAPPLPPAKPKADVPPDQTSPGPGSLGEDTPAPLPLPSPPESPPLPEAAPDQSAPPAEPPAAFAPSGQLVPEPAPTTAEACRERITRLGLSFTALPSVSEPGCTLSQPLEISGLGDGLALARATMNCEAAEALARWAQDVVAPEAQAHFKSRLVRLSDVSGYECRTRNGIEGAKPSEHAAGNAIDVGTFAFEGREPVVVAGPDADDATTGFRRAIRRGACAYFTTVLGPGADVAHAGHLHLDLIERENGTRICQ